MQPRVHSRRRSRRQNHLKTYLAIASLALATVLAVLVLFYEFDSGNSRLVGSPVPSTQKLWFGLLASPPTGHRSNNFGRVVYPYSVIAGGVRGGQELKEAISKDPVVAGHYASFKSDRARIAELPAEKAVYVSYRIGHEVYWTKKKIRLVRGEKLITDGENYARARCGNRISEAPQANTSPEEPSPKILETPVEPLSEEITGELIGPRPYDLEPPISLPPGGLLVPIIPVVPIGGGSGPNGGPTPPNHPVPPVTPVPEPGTLLLVVSGLAGCLGLQRRHRN